MKRDVSHVLILSALAQLAGFGKSILITYYFGVGATLDGYYLAQAIPATFSGVMVGFFQTGFLPLYSTHLNRGEDQQAAALLGRAVLLATTVGLAGSALIASTAATIVSALAGSSGAEAATSSAVTALRALAFLLTLNAIVDCLGLALNARHRYVAAAAAPSANAVLASLILVAAPEWGLTNLILGTLAGVSVQLIIVFAATRRAAIRMLLFRRSVESARMLANGAAILPGLLFANLAILVPPAFASRIGEGAIAALTIAGRLHGAISQVLAVAVSTVLLPHFAQAIARNESAEVIARLRSTFPTVLAIGLLIVLWVSAAGPGLVTLVFQRGAFDVAATEAVSSAWLWLTIGLVPTVWGTALSKALQAMQFGRLLSGISLISLSVLAAVCATGAAIGSLNLVAYASSLSAAVTTVVFAVSVTRRYFPEARDVPRLPSGIGLFVATSMIGVAIVAWQPLGRSALMSVVVTLVCGSIALVVVRGALAHPER